MRRVSVRELRNQGGKVLDRVQRGERTIITRDGEDVAELRPVRKSLSAEALIERRRNLPSMDPELLRRDIDEILDTNLWNLR
ncbi:MAG: type II toxin-antitoxin system prevent-host-death family antitoxin [Solirubrobacterales bacterium]|nr:type II toxin-antitoxin system prevent-host-death family antitoxin [Solirubrobacterales bacterium]HMT06031.1 type II toxin-antitoxin system prevent-host-death family antitoxin [Solirubrobacterales bacterium]